MLHFNEDTRVKFPATVQFLKLGYNYQSLKGVRIDFETKIFVDIFKSSLEKINGRKIDESEIENLLKEINLMRILKASQGAIFDSINLDSFRYIEIDIPTIEEQIKISNVLSQIDNQIEINNAMVKRLQVLAQAIFSKLFSKENRLISLLDFPYVKIIKPGIDKFAGKKHYIATADVEYDKLNYNATLIDYENRENRANMQPVKNSVWFAKMKNSIKHIFVTSNNEFLINNYIFSTGFCGIECDDFAFEYIISYLNLPYFEKEKDILAHGATMEGVNNSDLRLFKIHLPSKEKLLSFHHTTKKIYNQISEINLITFQLLETKNKLLPLLINGQLI